ncbi:putative lipid carrier protein YhbT [Sulfuritortus calidifontis]|uniref:Ubiquinone biosynthesis accessory factor UbiT n=1 Tax=Sulfuritortus calidifontis TaxID=1914471 RepID=A0A4R3K0P4_9PROT|nr:SCP2 sterol-binding domain-containing protein [Sulfuritortus calidifontis]TCS73829.1 putative lipid carrier protein YhbT [Sulfuritortus calidifontis]
MPLPAIPKPLARALGILPAFPASLAFCTAGNLSAWPTLRELDWSEVRGRRFCIRVRDLNLKFHFSVGPRGFVPEVAHSADVTFTATAEDFARLALRLEDPDTLFFNRRLLIEGDTDLGLRVKNMLDGVELETLAHGLPLGLGRVLLALRERAMQPS